MRDDRSMHYIEELGEDSRNASWIVASKFRPVLYSTNETKGLVQAMSIENTGVPSNSIGSVSCQGEGSTHIAESVDGDFLVVSNYHSGSISIIPTQQSDSHDSVVLGSAVMLAHSDGSGRSAHAHQCVMHPAQRVFYVCDLGLDAIYTYAYGPPSAPFVVTEVGIWRAPAGSGPRHLVLDKAASCAFVVFEVSNQVCMLSVNPVTGYLEDARSDAGDSITTMHSSVAAGVSAADMGAAEILLSEDGRFIYVSNRDVAPISADTTDRSGISVFAVLPGGAGLQWVQSVSSLGRHPRHMCFTERGACLLLANRDTQNIVAFSVNREAGMLDERSAVVSQCVPQCRDPGFILELPL